MAGLEVAGRRFRTEADYQAALRDQAKIKRIRMRINMDQPGEVIALYTDMQSGRYRFETAVGNDFDDEIYELAQDYMRQGYDKDSKLPTGKKASKSRKIAAKQVKASLNSKDKGDSQVNGDAGAKVSIDAYDKNMQKIILSELKKREKRRKLMIALCSVVAVASFVCFGAYSYFTDKAESNYTSLSNLKGSTTLVAGAAPTVTIHYTEEEDIELEILEEYQTLYNKNKSLIGWLKIDDTTIDYPVMQTVDNEYYLHHNYNQEYDKGGSLFMDTKCDVVHRNTNLIIYGHHMNSGKMFGDLTMYTSENYCKEHSTIQFDTIYEKGTYEVMYVFNSKIYNEDEIVFKYYQFLDAVSEKEFTSAMQEMAAMSMYDTGVTASYGDELLTLSTCDSAYMKDGRFVVVAKRIK